MVTFKWYGSEGVNYLCKAEAATGEGNNVSGMCAGAFIVSKLYDVLCPVNQAFIANITILYIH